MNARVQPYRAQHYLYKYRIALSDLVSTRGRSKSTWSRFLRREIEPGRGDPRSDIERELASRGLPIPKDLWHIDLQASEAGPDSGPEVNHIKEVTVQAQTLSHAAQKQWELFLSPFDTEALIDPAGGDRLDDLYLPVDHAVIENRLIQALTKAGFIALAGEPGSGKSTLLERAKRQAGDIRPLVLVRPANVERRKLSAVHLASEIIRQLSEQPVPRQANNRDALAEEVLTQRYEQGQRVALVIDEAHELPTHTVKDLKRFHELTHGFARLLAVILVGQSELRARFDLERNYQLREAIIRCQLLVLGPMAGDTAKYVRKRFTWIGREAEDVFTAAALDAVERRLAVHEQQYPVLIGNAATAAMNIAARRGNPKVTSEDVEQVWAATPDELARIAM